MVALPAMARRPQVIFFSLLAAVLLYSFPHFEEIRSANELPRAYLTRAMVDEGTFAIDRGVERWGRTADMSPSGGKTYSNKAPGSSFLAVPGYLVVKGIKAVAGSEPTLAETIWICRVTTGALPTLLFLLLLYSFLGRFVQDQGTRRLVVGGYALGTMALTYSVLYISHQLSAVCIGTAYIVTVWVVEDDRHPAWMLAAGLAAGAAPLVDYQAAFAGVPVAVYAVWHLARRRPVPWSSFGYAAVGAAIPIAVLLGYHSAAFGSPWATGYAASVDFAHHHQEGFLGLDRFRWEAFVGSFFSSDNGLFVFSPFLLWAIPGWVWMFKDRQQRWHAGITLAVFATYVLFVSSIIMWRGGWQMGPRYITAMLPFMMVPVVVAAARVDSSWLLRGLLGGSILAAIIIYSLSCAEFPHFPEKFKNPLYEVTFRLIGDGHAPYNAGWLLGLRGFASLVPYLLLVGSLAAWLLVPAKRYGRSAALAVALSAVVLAGYSTFPGGGKVADAAYDRWVAGVMPK